VHYVITYTLKSISNVLTINSEMIKQYIEKKKIMTIQLLGERNLMIKIDNNLLLLNTILFERYCHVYTFHKLTIVTLNL